MSTKAMKLCDRCGRIEGDKSSSGKVLQVLGMDCKLSNGARIVGDICTECLDDRLEGSHYQVTSKRRRNTFKVTAPEDIPTQKERGA